VRDILITVMVFGLLPFILRNAWYGVLAWSWLSYMNPHKLAWGFAHTMPFAQIVAIVLLLSLLMNREKKSLPANSLVIVWGLFLIWNVVCTIFAFYPEFAFDGLEMVLKIQLITLVTLLMMKNLQRINQLIWVIVFSIGFYSVKGGVFTLLTGGAYHVFGPEGSYIMENNTFAVAVLMIVPMMVYIYRFPPHPLVKKIMPICIFLSLVSVIGSQSRGAILAIGAVGGYFWWQSKAKVLTAIAFAFLGFFVVLFMPQSWHDRMASISEYEEDMSAMQRLRAWEYSFNLANDRFTGGGFNNWSMENYRIYAPEAKQAFVAHSIYFGVLGESGWVGLGLFVTVLFLVWRQLGRVIADTKDDPDRKDIHFLARMLQISMIAFMSGGAFLSISYFDLAWHIMAITVAMTQLGRERAKQGSEESRPGRLPRRRPSYRRRGPGAVR
tara:strand:+ start:3343 stop:4659 length:1317 start_codon:yes stop_codon:yes gene_type:complete